MRKISYKLGLMLISLFILLMVLIGHVFDQLYVHYYVDHIEHEMTFRSSSYAKVLAEYFDKQTLRHVAMMEEDQTAVVVVNPEGIILSCSGPITPAQKEYLQPLSAKVSSLDGTEADWTASPYIVKKSLILKGQNVLGTVIMFFRTAPIRKEVNEIHLAVILFGISFIIISSLIIFLFSKQITQPLIRIKQMSQQIAMGNYYVQLPVKGRDEITDLTIAINSMSKELLRYETTRNEFLSNISHELRTPLMYIKGYADLLIQDRIPDLEERNNYLTYISEETLRVQHLVKDLFDLTKYKDRKIFLEIEQVNLVDFFWDIVRRSEVEMAKKQIGCHFYSNRESIFYQIDRERMEQVLVNLLENARTYTPENGEISVRLEEKDSSLLIEIEDNGIGIPDEELPFIWERFYRVEKSRSRNFGGTGLGLPIAKEIVELHGGHIEASSVEGKGTVFRIYLPGK